CEAEKRGLHLICGIGYRKALEFLIKDYGAYLNPDKTEEIQRTPLSNCIKQYIKNRRIKSMAEKATWIGNDEAHYKRKWESMDVQDLKNLINITVSFITTELLADKYEQAMSRS
ncbi:DUF4145 domain-containing protein, partial [Brevibacillus laterosporus]